jgi:hypothetical protein
MSPTLAQQYEDWYTEYHFRISEWITDCAIGRPAHLILALPHLIQSLLTASQLATLSDSLRAECLAQANSAMQGMDYLPRTSIATSTLIQDSLAIARFLQRHLEAFPAALQAQMWEGDDTLVQTLAWMLREDGQPPRRGC